MLLEIVTLIHPLAHQETDTTDTVLVRLRYYTRGCTKLFAGSSNLLYSAQFNSLVLFLNAATLFSNPYLTVNCATERLRR